MIDLRSCELPRKMVWLALISPAWMMTGCGSSSDSTTSGYVSQHDDRWRTRSINVCFTQGDPGLNVAKNIVMQSINEEFSKLGFRFNVSNQCFGGHVIRIDFVRGSTSAVNEIGSGVSRVSLGVDHECYNTAGQPVYYLESNCLRNIAVHEFGHVLGLHHEMNRRDNNDRCELDQTHGMGERGAIQIGDYDNASVMNYCEVMRRNSRNQRLPLSSGDVETLRAIYDGPVATVDSMPSDEMSDLSWINFRVKGAGVTEFQLKFGPSASVNCKNPSGYSNFLPVSYQNTGEELSRVFLGGNIRPRGDYRICLIGKNAQRTQPYGSYSSIDVTIP